MLRQKRGKDAFLHTQDKLDRIMAHFPFAGMFEQHRLARDSNTHEIDGAEEVGWKQSQFKINRAGLEAIEEHGVGGGGGGGGGRHHFALLKLWILIRNKF